MNKIIVLLCIVISSLLLMTGNCFGKDASKLLLLLNDPLLFDRPQTTTNSEVGKALIQVISEASVSIDFALYGIRDQDMIIQALLDAKSRGVKIRGVVDKDIENKNYYTSTTKLLEAFPDIKTDYEIDIETAQMQHDSKWTPYCERPEGFNGPLQCVGFSLSEDKCVVAAHASRKPLEFKGDIMHNKFFVIDRETVWTGSTNGSDSGTGGYNANTAVVIRSKKIAGWFTQEFEQMYTYGFFHRTKIVDIDLYIRLLKQQKTNDEYKRPVNVDEKQKKLSVKLDDGSTVEISFSPQGYSIERLVRPLIKKAKSYIDVPVFFLTHVKLAGDLIAAHQRGVNVRVIIDATAAKNGYTKHELLKAAGVQVKVENWGGKMHMKTAVIDGKYLVTGSMNWTAAGESKNDENTLIIYNKKHASAMHEFFNRLWNSIPEKWLQGNPDPESLNSSTACFDGVDNDFDKLVDAYDPGCSKTPPALPHLPPYSIVPKTDGYNLVKGNISQGKKKGFFGKKRKIYQVPGSPYYDNTKIDVNKGEKWFCSIYDARENGWKSYKAYRKSKKKY